MKNSLRDDLKVVDEAMLITILCEKLDLKTSHSIEFLRYALANARLFDRKQLDYGPRNVSGFGSFGILVRMNDKFERLKHLFGKKRKASNEPVTDSFRDISNYGIIAMMVQEGVWKNE